MIKKNLTESYNAFLLIIIFYPIFLLSPYHIGTRIGENFRPWLKMKMWILKEHELHIKRAVSEKLKKTWFVKPPKYDSYRTIKMGKTLEQVLKNTIKAKKINQMKYGGQYMKTYLLPDSSITQIRADVTVPYKEITPLCVKDNGVLLTPDSFKYCARVVHYELGNVLFHAHCLRHTSWYDTCRRWGKS